MQILPAGIPVQGTLFICQKICQLLVIALLLLDCFIVGERYPGFLFPDKSQLKTVPSGSADFINALSQQEGQKPTQKSIKETQIGLTSGA